MLPVGFFHFESPDIRLIFLDIIPFRKRNSIKSVCNIEHGRTDILQQKVRFQRLFIQVIFLFTELLGIIPPVPWLQLEFGTFLIDHSLQFSRLFLCNWERRCPDLIQESIHGRRVLSHIFFQDIIGMGRITQQVGPFQTK